jgi:hypothetical protein
MKKLLLLVLLFISVVANAQKGISYQAVILDPAKIEIPGSDISGQPLVNGDVWVKFAILSGTNLQFEEIQQTKTDAYGLVNLTIGSVASTAFNSVTWDANQKSLQVFVSFDNGSSYTKVSDQKLTYSPYALFAETAGKLGSTLGIAGGGTGATTAVGARANFGLGNVDNTADVDKPISTATKAALDLKANISDVNSALALKATVAALEAHMAITADTTMLATKAALTDLNDYAPINSPTFTGTVSGIDKSMVGLGSVDNTSDAAKPISTATQAALNIKSDSSFVNAALALKANAVTIDSLIALKATLESPTLTGAPKAPTASPRTNSTQIATTAYTDAAVAAATASATVSLADNSVTDAKITSIAGSKITGVIPVTSGGTGQTTVAGILSTMGFASNNIAIGSQAGTPNQGVNKGTIAIGGGAGRGNQGQSSIAIGYVSGDQNQGANSVSIGGNSAQANQAGESVAIGFAAGQTNQGTGAIAIGTFAGQSSQAANSIALNAAGSASPLNPTTSGLFVNPIRNTTATSNVLYYNTTTKEVTSGSITSGTAITVGTISSTSNSNGASITDGVLNLTPANASNGGIVTTGSQTFAGAKTFSSDLSVNGKLALGSTTPNAESSLDITTALPVILPKMTQTQVSAIANPSASMLQFNTTSKKMQVYKESIASTSSVFGNTTLSAGATCLRGSGELWFRPTISGTITQIELSAFGAGEVASLVINSNYAGASPTATLLGSSNSITAVDGWNTWTFATPVPVVANTTYFITSRDANRCLGVRWANSGDDSTTGNVDNMGFGNPLSSYDPASRITVVVPATNGWVNLRDDLATTNLSSEVTNVLPVANGGTGSSTKNFVDLSSAQTVAGTKSFSGSIVVGATSATGSSAALEVKSTTQGLLLPRLTSAQRDAIVNPLEGLILFNTSNGKFQGYTSNAASTVYSNTSYNGGGSYVGLSHFDMGFGSNPMLAINDDGQSFSVPSTYSLNSITVRFETVNYTSDITLSVYSGNIGAGILLGSVTNSVSTTGEKTFIFSSPLKLTAGNYYFQVHGSLTTNSGLNYSTSPYSSGAFFQTQQINGGNVSYNINANESLYFIMNFSIPGWVDLN